LGTWHGPYRVSAVGAFDHTPTLVSGCLHGLYRVSSIGGFEHKPAAGLSLPAGVRLVTPTTRGGVSLLGCSVFSLQKNVVKNGQPPTIATNTASIENGSGSRAEPSCRAVQVVTPFEKAKL
jgi:hypothetical protein